MMDKKQGWAEFMRRVNELEKKQKPRVPDAKIGIQYLCPFCGGFVGYLNEHCENCGQKLDWED